MRKSIITFGIILAILAVDLAAVAASAAGPNAGKRVVVVTERIDQPGRHESIHHSFVIGDQDRVYVTRHEAEIVHTDTGLSDEVVFEGSFGNMTVSRLQR